MREYELNIIIQPEISDEGSQAILAKLDDVLESGDAIRLLCQDLGKRRLAYEIRKFHKGHYYLLSFLDEGKVVPVLERILRLEESVLRFLTVKVADLVTDIEGRRAVAKEREAELKKRAAEKAAREAEEAKARAESEQLALEEAAARAEMEDAAEAEDLLEEADEEGLEPESEDDDEHFPADEVELDEAEDEADLEIPDDPDEGQEGEKS